MSAATSSTENPRLPKIWIIEQVPNLKTRHKDVFEKCLNLLKAISVKGSRYYHIQHRVLNTIDHGGLPQHRPRLYIVGIAIPFWKFPLEWPTVVKPKPLSQMIDASK